MKKTTTMLLFIMCLMFAHVAEARCPRLTLRSDLKCEGVLLFSDKPPWCEDVKTLKNYIEALADECEKLEWEVDQLKKMVGWLRSDLETLERQPKR